jgi:glycosyltransferase involved in cell wall biosynthesis
MSVPRVAFITDCFHEVNGVALTSRQLHDFAARRRHPFFSIHIGQHRRTWREGSVTTMELDRSRFRMALDADMFFDFAFTRHLNAVRRELQQFRPDVIHITGPGDCGILGLTLARQLHVPLVASWHTDLHKYAGRRLVKLLPFLPAQWRANLDTAAERGALAATLRFYREAAVTLAPNPDLTAMLEGATGRPCILMRRGIDTKLFHPGRRDRTDGKLVLGYVGRLSTEKGIRLLVNVEQALRQAGIANYKFVIVGQGSEREYLAENLSNVEFTGVLKGEALARAYANMDLFLFPSRTDTFGNVIQESLACGTPAVVFAEGGPKFLIDDGETGLRAKTEAEFVAATVSLAQDRDRLSKMANQLRSSTLDRSWDSVFEEVWRAYRLAAADGGIRLPVKPPSSATPIEA